MINDPSPTSKKRSKKGIILISILAVLLTAAFLVYLNFNKLLSTALRNVYESSQVADVYELNFKNLRVNPIDGNISVLDVTFQRKENPRKAYSYINSSVLLKTDKLILKNVDLFLLLRSNQLTLEQVAIIRPEMELDVNGYNPIFFPFNDPTAIATDGVQNKIESYFLAEFELIDASFRLINSARKREFTIENFNISFKDLLLEKNDQEDLFFLREMEISLEKFSGVLLEDEFQTMTFSDFNIKFDSVDAQKNLDTLIFNFENFTSEINELDIQTRDSLFHITMNSFDLSYQDQEIKLEKLSFKPNVSNATIQKNYKFQHTQFSGTVKTIDIQGVDFDSMLYYDNYFVETVTLDSIAALIYKDNTKAKDLNHFPEYLGQAIMGIPSPIRIKTVKATQVNLINEERKPDASLARVHVTNGTFEANNITNLAPDETMTLQAVALLADKVEMALDLEFSYAKTQFGFKGLLKTFNLKDINPIIAAYSPATFNAGVADEIRFEGTAQKSSATGKLTFLYHDLNVNLVLEDKAKWKNDLITFGANTALHTNNPTSADKPAREVKFRADRDMNKSFVNLIIKSILDGMKETMILSKENRKDFNQAKRDARREAKKDR